jgi:uncharacterized protein (TIGR01244 family)
MKCLYPVLLITALSLQALQAKGEQVPIELDWTGFRSGVYITDNLILAGQPLSDQAMQKLSAEGVSTIINLRTPGEMADTASTPIDEAMLSDRLGIRYVQLPSGGPENPFSHETVRQFAAAYSNSEGRVLLHCNSGRRATHLWVAYLATHLNIDINEAIILGQSANFGHPPLEGYLGSKLEYRLSKEPSSPLILK